MADNVQEVTKTLPPPQDSTDDNRRRTRSQTRNGGVTPPAPKPETRGRKRASPSQPGSAGKRGRKAAQTIITPIEAVSNPATEKKSEAHSKQADNQDLSKKKPSATVSSKRVASKRADAVQKKLAEEVKSHTEEDLKDSSKSKKDDVQEESAEENKLDSEDELKNSNEKKDDEQKASGNASGDGEKEIEEKKKDEQNVAKDSCKVKKAELEVKPEESATLEKNDAGEVQKKEEKPAESTEVKTSVDENSCTLPKKVELGASGDETKKDSPIKDNGEANETVGEEEKTQVVEKSSKSVVETAKDKIVDDSSKQEA